MLYQGLKTLNELEALKEKEKQEQEEAKRAAQLAMQVATTINLFMLFIKEELCLIDISPS